MFSSKDYRDNVDHDFQVTGGDIDDMDSDNILDHGNISSLEMAAHDAALTDGLIHPQGMKINENKTKKLGLRRGKWTPEEEYYANRLIQEFKSGLLPLTDGTTLRTFLSKLLNCDPMRISKKFVGQNCIGKQVFRRRQQDLDKLTADQVERSRRELAELERKFLERVAQTNRSKTTSGSVKPIKDSKLYDETTGIVAPWMRQPDDFANDYSNNNSRYPSLLNQPISSNPQGHNNNMFLNTQNMSNNYNQIQGVSYDSHMMMNHNPYNQYEQPQFNIMKYDQEARQSTFSHTKPNYNNNYLNDTSILNQPNQAVNNKNIKMKKLNDSTSTTKPVNVNTNPSYTYPNQQINKIKIEDEKLLNNNNRITSLDVLYSLDGMDSIPNNISTDNTNRSNHNKNKLNNNINISRDLTSISNDLATNQSAADFQLMNSESNLQAILAWPSMTSLINVNVDDNINNDEMSRINNNESTNSHSSSDNQQLLSGMIWQYTFLPIL